MGHLCSYGQVSECFPEFDVTNDQFNEMSKSKEQLLDDIFEGIKPPVEKIIANSNENTDKVLAQVNAVEDNTNCRTEQILNQNHANTNILIAHFEEVKNMLKSNPGTGE